MSEIDFGHILQIASLANSFFAAVAATLAFFGSRRNGNVVRETKYKVERVELMVNGHVAARIEDQRKIARAEGVADALQAVVEAEKILLQAEKEP